MRILLTGSSGLVGTALREHWVAHGWEIRRLVRGPVPSFGDCRYWDPTAGVIDATVLDGVDAVVHLAGEAIAEGRWTAAKKRRIRESRIQSTALIARTIAKAISPPPVLICASAVGIYGDRGQEWVGEESAPGCGFLSQVCVDWEAAASPALSAGVRCVFLRLGIVLSSKGGALARMLPFFRWGLGGRIGSGDQMMSWIGIDDLLCVVDQAIQAHGMQGPVNAVTPCPVSNREFTRLLAARMRRPAWLPAPAWALRLFFGEMAEAALLASVRVRPQRLLDAGFTFRHPELSGWLSSARF